MAASLPVALIGDLVGSREEPPAVRQELQRTVAALVREEVERLGPARLAGPLVQTAGDEIQALFRGPDGVVELVSRATERLLGRAADRPIAFGIGLGALTTPPLPEPPGQIENVALADGPAFHRARAALERARKRREWAVFEGFGATGDLVLDALFQSMWALRGRWTAVQGLYAREMRRLGVQKEVAREHGISPSVVSESLKAASFDVVLASEEAARRALAHFAALAERP